MPSSITLAGLSWSAPDGTPLFSDLHLAFGAERTGIVGRNGTGKSTLLRLIAGELSPAAGRVNALGSLALMRQNTPPDPAETIADLFGVRGELALLDRAEAGRASAEELAEVDWTLPARIEQALSRCGLARSPLTPLGSLSGGQHTRAGLAALVFTQPDFLLLDEPTNNLDTAGRTAVIEFLRSWKGGAIVVSHERALLQEMDAIVELTTLGGARYGGNYEAYRARKREELEAARRDLSDAERARAEVGRRARAAAERKARKNGAGHRARARKDQPKILMDAAKERAEASGGSNLRLRDARRQAAEEAVSAARCKIETLQPVNMEIASTGLPPGRTVLRLDRLTGGYDPARPVIRDLTLTITGPERVAIAGPNGSGKTTLVSLITGALPPQGGSVRLDVPLALLDQHVSLIDPGLSLSENFLRRDPGAGENRCRSVFARFGFRAGEALKKGADLSGGERLRAGLACTLGRAEPPTLLILDEPTNHLDLDAVEALESALTAYDGALLVISHDEAFLERLGINGRLALDKT